VVELGVRHKPGGCNRRNAVESLPIPPAPETSESIVCHGSSPPGVNPLLGNIFHRQKEMLYGSFVFPYLSLSLSWRIKRESLLYPIPVLGSNRPKVILHSWVILIFWVLLKLLHDLAP